jgi:hypothetical protein
MGAEPLRHEAASWPQLQLESTPNFCRVQNHRHGIFHALRRIFPGGVLPTFSIIEQEASL